MPISFRSRWLGGAVACRTVVWASDASAMPSNPAVNRIVVGSLRFGADCGTWRSILVSLRRRHSRA
eukprot:14186780-Alexandrium_andersonii.AAC.1